MTLIYSSKKNDVVIGDHFLTCTWSRNGCLPLSFFTFYSVHSSETCRAGQLHCFTFIVWLFRNWFCVFMGNLFSTTYWETKTNVTQRSNCHHVLNDILLAQSKHLLKLSFGKCIQYNIKSKWKRHSKNPTKSAYLDIGHNLRKTTKRWSRGVLQELSFWA